MDIWRALKVVGRRWYVSLTVLLLCAAATSSLVAQADAKYTANAVITLLPPSVKLPAEAPVETFTNPYMQTGIAHAAVSVASAANSDVVADQLKAEGLADVEFTVATFDGSPILSIIVDSNNFADTQRGVQVVIAGVQTLAQQLQLSAGSPEGQLITTQVLAPAPGAPVESLAPKTRVALGMGVATILAVMTASLVFDDLATRARRLHQARRTARTRKPEPGSTDPNANGHGPELPDLPRGERVNGHHPDSLDLVPLSSPERSTSIPVRNKSGSRRASRSKPGA